jgi:hypothetical protein
VRQPSPARRAASAGRRARPGAPEGPQPDQRAANDGRFAAGAGRRIAPAEQDDLHCLVARWVSAHNARGKRRLPLVTAWARFNQAMGVAEAAHLPLTRWQEAVHWLQARIAVAEFAPSAPENPELVPSPVSVPESISPDSLPPSFGITTHKKSVLSSNAAQIPKPPAAGEILLPINDLAQIRPARQLGKFERLPTFERQKNRPSSAVELVGRAIASRCKWTPARFFLKSIGRAPATKGYG